MGLFRGFVFLGLFRVCVASLFVGLFCEVVSWVCLVICFVSLLDEIVLLVCFGNLSCGFVL